MMWLIIWIGYYLIDAVVLLFNISLIINFECLNSQLDFTIENHDIFYKLYQRHHSFTQNYHIFSYRKTSCISRTKSQSLNVSCTLLHLPSLNPLKPGVKLRMKM